MYIIKDVYDMLLNVVKSMKLMDILDILLLTYFIYLLIKLMKETRAGQLIKGILLYSATYLICRQLELKAITYLLEKTFSIGLIAVVIVFQPELRRALEKVGRAKVNVFSLGENSTESNTHWQSAIHVITDACDDLSSTLTGALIVLERQTKLGEQVDTGTVINAKPSRELICNIFYPKTPLHDGAVIVRDGMLLAAACYLPKPQKEELINKQLGSRHRAAIGMSENSDSIIVVVSEETGIISVAENGELSRGFNKDELREFLSGKFLSDKTSESKPKVKKNKNKNKGGKI